MSNKLSYGSKDRDNHNSNYLSKFELLRSGIGAAEIESGVSEVIDLTTSVKAYDNIIRLFLKEAASGGSTVGVSLYEKVPTEVSTTPTYKLVGTEVNGVGHLDDLEFTSLYGGTDYKVVITSWTAGSWSIYSSHTH